MQSFSSTDLPMRCLPSIEIVPPNANQAKQIHGQKTLCSVAFPLAGVHDLAPTSAFAHPKILTILDGPYFVKLASSKAIPKMRCDTRKKKDSMPLASQKDPKASARKPLGPRPTEAFTRTGSEDLGRSGFAPPAAQIKQNQRT